MRYVLHILDMPGSTVIDPQGVRGRPDPVGMFVAAINVDAYEGRGTVLLVDHADGALAFETPAAAMDAWREQSTVRPYRPDGLPNRPATAFTVEILPVP